MPKKVKGSAKQDRKGIAAVQGKTVRDLDWIFREQPTDDYGIDAQIEIVADDEATGRLLAAQIKSGPSYFRKPHADGDGWWFQLDRDDLTYWLDHALPVVVVLYDPSTDQAYWQVVTKRTVTTGKRGGKKILVPQSQTLDAKSKGRLQQVAEGNPYELRIRRLRLALPWMRELSNGRRILLEANEWVNKTSGRGDLQIVSTDDAGEDRQALGSWLIMLGSRPYEDVLPTLVPWADVVLHEETYDEADRDRWTSECVWQDREGDTHWSESFDDWRLQFDGVGLRPYANGAGEVDFWRLELVLNDLGRGFAAVDEYAEGDGRILTPSRDGQ
ncbi:DUF4365 domain-containing protein [Frondihabitans sp. VKM Ac-2883]|uniref:DUF4365 domain-containing protein n=1 Tax=Frondihabitans sp. VKM Ac-2883 TaxID=2783823 RepID=UPI00188C69F7|nr:DUF4365 domain-containing protein [Frondihabitans sp. VKM Ac-2883]